MNFDVAIIGGGIAGAFATARLMENNKNLIIVFFI